jgi:beta-lactamase class A
MKNYEKLVEKIEKYVSNQNANISVSFCDLRSDFTFNVEGDKKSPSASMIKLLIMAEVLDEVDKKKLSLNEKYIISPHNIVEGSGIVFELEEGHEFSLKEIIKLMIILSDNSCTNFLIDLVSMEKINKMGKMLDLKNTVLQRKMMDLESAEKGFDNYTSSNDIMNILKLIYDGKLINEEMSSIALEILLCQKLNYGLKKYLPEELKLASKSGDLENLENDGGIFFTDTCDYILTVLVNGTKNYIAKDIIAEISKMVYCFMEV